MDMGGRHLFSNRRRPSECPILWLAIYFASTGSEIEGQLLFPGGEQRARYGAFLRGVLDGMPDVNLKEICGDASDIGTHSLRKGVFGVFVV